MSHDPEVEILSRNSAHQRMGGSGEIPKAVCIFNRKVYQAQVNEYVIFPGAFGLNVNFNNYSHYFCRGSTFEST